MISSSQLIRLIADAKHFGYDYQFSIEDDVYVVSFQHPDYEKPFVIAFDEFGQPHYQYGVISKDFYYYRNHFDDLYAGEQRKEKEKLIEQLSLTEEQIQILGISL